MTHEDAPAATREIQVPRDLLRPVIERTLDVVRAGLRATPPRPAPPTIAPLLRFRTLPPAAHDTVVVALDADADLRARVGAELVERDTNRVAWLWLTRPAGWDAELRDALGDLAEDGAPSAADVGSDAQLRRRLAGAERALARAELRAQQAGEHLARSRARLEEVQAAEEQWRAQAGALEAEVGELRAERARAVGEVKRLEQILARRDDERRSLHEQLAALDAALTRARQAPQRAVHEPGPPDGPPAIDSQAFAALAGRIERAIGEAALLLDELRAAAGIASPEAAGTERPAERAPAPRRRPLRMPRGLTDDSVEAASWLLTERPALLVDGYNVSMTAWPDADIAEQRSRLVRLLADLAARSPGLAVELVFDGAATDATPASLAARLGVNVRFTAPDVEADDELLEMISRVAVSRPVVVVSSDRRVRDGARRRGANVLSAHQLLAVARG